MSKKEHDKYFSFVLNRDGAICSRCRKDLTTIKKEWFIVNPNRKRKLEWLLLHHVDGDERFADSRDGTYAGNLKLVCSSCNAILRVRKIAPSTLREKTPEMERKDSAEPKFFTWLDYMCTNFAHICEEKMFNRGAAISGVLQPSIKRYFLKKVHYDYERFDITLHDVTCKYPECKGIHVCMFGEKPRMKDMIAEIVHQEEQQEVE